MFLRRLLKRCEEYDQSYSWEGSRNPTKLHGKFDEYRKQVRGMC